MWIVNCKKFTWNERFFWHKFYLASRNLPYWWTLLQEPCEGRGRITNELHSIISLSNSYASRIVVNVWVDVSFMLHLLKHMLSKLNLLLIHQVYFHHPTITKQEGMIKTSQKPIKSPLFHTNQIRIATFISLE
jgi:hypothetical protein